MLASRPRAAGQVPARDGDRDRRSHQLSAVSTLPQRLAALGSCGIADAQDGRGLVSPGLVRLSGTGAIAGPAVTAACEDGSAGGALYAMAEAQPGDVLCVVCPGETASIGDLVM